MAKKKCSKPTVSPISRDGYTFTLSFSNIDSDASHIYIERWIYEKKDSASSSNTAKEYKKVKLNSSGNSSWSFTIDPDDYYPFKSDYSQRIDRIKCKVWVDSASLKASEAIIKTYSFQPAAKPTVSLTYTEDGTAFNAYLAPNDDYSIDDSVKKVCTRTYMWITRQVKGGKETKLANYDGNWYTSARTINLRTQIVNDISPTTPVKYTICAYSAGPGGKSDTVKAVHVFAQPKVPKKPTITVLRPTVNSDGQNVNNGFYDVSYDIVTDYQSKASPTFHWYPVDNVTIQYRDQNQHKGASDIYGENMGSWSVAKDNIHYSINKIQTDDLGAVADDNVRYFRLKVEHDGTEVPSYVSNAIAYGKPSNVTNVTATSQVVYEEVNGVQTQKQVMVLNWTNTVNQLYNSAADTTIPKTRLLIFEKTSTKSLIKTIYCTDDEWEDEEYIIEDFDTFDQTLNYGFQIRVGYDNYSTSTNPGASSEILYTSDVYVPNLIKNVRAEKLANNTTVLVTWDNPTAADTITNGIEVAWSTMPHVWESNESPSTATFDNGIMSKAYITGLTAGECYYFWARRYEETDDDTSYGLWSDPSAGILLSDKPNEPTLTTSRSWIKEGGSMTVQWIYSASGNLPQESAQVEVAAIRNIMKSAIVAPIATEQTTQSGNAITSVLGEFDGTFTIPKDGLLLWEIDSVNKYVLFESPCSNNIIVSALTWTAADPSHIAIDGGFFTTSCYTYDSLGDIDYATLDELFGDILWTPLNSVTGEETSCSIDLSVKEQNVYKYPAGNYFLRVVVKNSMGNTSSQPTDFIIATNPTCTLSSSSLVSYSYTTTVDDGTEPDETTTVTALRGFPFSVTVDGEGDLSLYLYSAGNFEYERPDKTHNLFSGDCVWTSEINAGTWSLSNVHLIDNAHYRLQLECVDSDTLLKATPAYIDFEVHWTNQAVAPSDSTVSIDDGIATLVPIMPTGASSTDVCDIYRVTADGNYLCAENVPWGSTVIDTVPTFGNTSDLSYRFCTRTTDGDEAWSDIEYEYEQPGVIINYGLDSVHLPWNVVIDDSRTKQGELRSHLGGTKLYYGQPFIDRKQSLSAEVVKLENEDLVEQLYELSRFTDICYVRTSNCIGYPAAVDVSINREYNNKIVSISLSVTEADSNGEYMASIEEDS